MSQERSIGRREFIRTTTGVVAAGLGVSTAVCRQIANAPGFAYLESKNCRKVEVLKSAGYLSGRKQVRVSAAASDIDPCELEWSCIIEGTSSGSLLPIISMMQATDALEGNQTRGLIRLGRNRSHRRCVFLKRVVDSVGVIIKDVIPDQTAQMNVIEDDQVIEKLSATCPYRKVHPAF